jgi:Dolichyl-phosphate-mannose-protein mannosyltransferase
VPRGLLAGGLGALVMLLVGEIAPGLFPVRVALEVRGGHVEVSMDGGKHGFDRDSLAWDHLQFEQPGPEDREVQVDGSETVGRGDREPEYIRGLAATPLYAVGAWLRDEASFSRWEDVRLFEAQTGQQLAEGRAASEAVSLPAAFRVEASLRHPEAPARIWLTLRDRDFKEGLAVDRNEHSAAWVREPSGGTQRVDWFFPVQAAPFAADLLQLAGRAVAAAYLLLAGVILLGWIVRPMDAVVARIPRAAVRSVAALLALGSLALSAAISVALYHQLPHMVDSTNYYVQAGMFLSGHLWFEPPAQPKFFTLLNQVLWEHRWFMQYPPGAPTVYALGRLVGLAWLVGPLTAVLMVVCIAEVARVWFGRRTALAALGLGAVSPFILFQAGAFMSHPIAGAALAGGLAAFAHGERSRRLRLFGLAGACLGFAFLTREFSAVLFAIPLAAWLVFHRNWRALAPLLVAGLPFLLAYFAYNGAVTRDPFASPRAEVDPGDHPGFGPNHTLAQGLAFADQDLTDLQFELFGWPPIVGLSIMALPFVLGKATRRDLLVAGGAVLIVSGFVAVSGHGIGAMGPRYYYEGLPWFVLLAARGVQAAAGTAGQLGLSRTAARTGAAALLGCLTLYAFGFYMPRLIERRTDFSALSNGHRYRFPFVEATLTGPQLRGFNGPTIVLVGDEKMFQTLAALNCSLLDGETAQACPVLFLHAGRGDIEQIAKAYPGRTIVRAEARGELVELTDPAR